MVLVREVHGWYAFYCTDLTASVQEIIEAFDNKQPTLLITGSNRNIGLEFVKQYSEKKWNVIVLKTVAL